MLFQQTPTSSQLNIEADATSDFLTNLLLVKKYNATCLFGLTFFDTNADGIVTVADINNRVLQL